MDKRFAQNLVAYIESTNNLLCKYAAQSERFQQFLKQLETEKNEYQEKLAEAIDIMASDGVIPKEYTEAIFNSMKDSPTKAAEFLKKVNNGPKRLGKASSNLSSVGRDPIVEFCLS